MTNDIYEKTASRKVPQSEQAAPGQEKNAAGGFVFTISPLERAKRFLILGSDGGSFYASAPELTRDNAANLEKLLSADSSGTALVELIKDVSVRGLAPKTQPVLFALALALATGSPETKKAAEAALPEIARTGTHLLTVARYVNALGGWSRGKRRAVASWFLDKDADSLAYQVVKYRSRDGWSMADVLRVSHPKSAVPEIKAVFDWISGRPSDLVPQLMKDWAKALTIPVSEIPALVASSNLSWEMLPDEALADPKVWEALLDRKGGLPLGALLRQLPRLTRVGLIGSPLLGGGSRTAEIVARLTNPDELRKARIHPINLLIAGKTYAKGTARSGGEYTPAPAIVKALEDAFYAAFHTVPTAGKRTMIALDVSGSMWWPTSKDPSGNFFAAEVGGAFALVISATEPNSEVFAFSSGSMRSRTQNAEGISRLNVTPGMRLSEMDALVRAESAGGTDISLPMLHASKHNLQVDTFVVITDNETWAGAIHPYKALEDYRKKSGIPAKLVVLAVTPTEFTIANPNDSGMLDIVGFSADVPTLVTNFSAGL